jgi:hypothetical protein
LVVDAFFKALISSEGQEQGFNLIHFYNEHGIEYKRIMIYEKVLFDCVVKAVEGEPLRRINDIVNPLHSFGGNTVNYDCD